MQGGDPNTMVRTLCESIVRHQIATMVMKDVMTNRDKIRKEMKDSL